MPDYFDPNEGENYFDKPKGDEPAASGAPEPLPYEASPPVEGTPPQTVTGDGTPTPEKGTRKFTNRPELLVQDPTWELVRDNKNPQGTFAPGASGPTSSTGAEPGGPEMQPSLVPQDPRLGANPQGDWSLEKMMRIFPEMFAHLSPEDIDMATGAAKSKPAAAQQTGAKAPPPRMDRNSFEQIIFKQIGGNPFVVDPYREVVKADAQLPQLFEEVFAGRATWADLPHLSKEDRAFWEKTKQAFHAQVLNEVKSRKQTMLQQYNWMMGKFDEEQKTQQAAFARQEKEQARLEARQGKTPTFRALFNADGVQTLHRWDPEVQDFVDTGRRTGTAALEDRMPARMKEIQTFLNRYLPKPIDPAMALALGMLESSNPEAAKAMRAAMTPVVSPEMKPTIDALSKEYNDYWAQEAKKIAAEGRQQAGVPQPAQGAPEKPNPQRDLGLLIDAKKRNHPNLQIAIQAFVQAHKDPKLWALAEEKLGLAPGTLNRMRGASSGMGEPVKGKIEKPTK